MSADVTNDVVKCKKSLKKNIKNLNFENRILWGKIDEIAIYLFRS